MLLGEDLANHVRLTKRVGMVTYSQAKQASTFNSIPEPPTGTQPEVVESDSRPESMAAVVDPVPGAQQELAQGSKLMEQSAPKPMLTTPPESGEPAPKGATESAPAAAAKPAQEAQPEHKIPPSTPPESGSQSTEATPSPASLPVGPCPSPQLSKELMSPASREQFQEEQEADERLKGAWMAARSNPPPFSSSNRNEGSPVYSPGER
ncbi:predicted GPI-anchored protein 58 [Dermochelys coriacea]|uniref:predicted GPI-anchored protein 58 n=1 Tax=Dermochelys coriacea TaxID=27794 RepID=UPI0018E6DD0E|nr:predicted GPI-anchored protein 58 [Dermochelys coriacea]